MCGLLGKKQIDKVPGSEQVVVKDALHFFEGREDELVKLIVGFLDRIFHKGDATTALSR
jgi:alpha/beta superfamily hydrolase